MSFGQKYRHFYFWPFECSVIFLHVFRLPAPAQEIHLEDHACDPCMKYSLDESKIDTFMTKCREGYNS